MALSIYDKFITQTDSGETIPLATVQVNTTGVGAGLASLYDARTGGSLLTNPLNADADGRITFYVEPGRYTITATYGGGSITYSDVIVDPEDINSTTYRSTTVGDYLDSIKIWETVDDAKSMTDSQASTLSSLKQDISTRFNNLTSKLGGCDYQIYTLSDYRVKLGDPAWVPDGHCDHYVASGLYVAVMSPVVVDLDQIGCDRTGAVDFIPALKAAIDLGKVVEHNSGGSFLMGSQLYLVNGTRISIHKGEIIRDSDVRIRGGNKDTKTALVGVGTFSKGSYELELDSSSYSAVEVGDKIVVQSNPPVHPDYIEDFVDTPNVLNDWVYQIQVVDVVEKVGSNIVSVSSMAKMDYNFTGDSTVWRLDNWVQDIKFKSNFRNIDGAVYASTESAFFNLSATFDVDITGSIFKLNNRSPGIYMTYGSLISGVGTKFYDGRNLDIFLRQHCVGSKVIGSSFYNHRTNDASVFIEAHNYNVSVIGNDFSTAFWDDSAGMISAVQCDAKVNNCTITGNTVFGYAVGVRLELGSFQNTVSSNTFQLCALSGVRMVGTQSNVIDGNTFLDCGLSDTSRPTESQQQGGVYVNGCKDESITNNSFTWISPDFSNFCSALSGTMVDSSFTGNIVKQSQRAVWLIGGGGNEISNNPLLDVDDTNGNDYVVYISGTSNHYNKIKNNTISGNDTADSAGIYIGGGSEGNTVFGNETNDVIYGVFRSGSSEYQCIHSNYGEGLRSINSAITAPAMPTNANAKRGFRIYNVEFTDTSANGTKYWEYTQGTSPTARWIEFDLTSLNSVVNI